MTAPLIDRLRNWPQWAYWLAAGALVVLIAAFLLRPKTVALLINGEPELVSTRALTVRGALRAAGIDPAETAEIEPGLGAWLRDHQVVQVLVESDVHIVDGEDRITITTAERTPAGWLAQAGLVVSPADALYVQGQPVAADALQLPDRYYELVIHRAAAIEFLTDGQPQTLNSAAPTLGEALYADGHALRVADQLSVAHAAAPETANGASLATARPVSIHLGDRTLHGFSAARTVGGALADAGVALQGLDISVPIADDPLPESGEIRVVRVREGIEITQNLLPFETQLQALPEVEIDTQQIVQVGQYGVEAQRVRVRYEDGQEVNRSVEDSWVAQEAVPRIEGYGTNIEIRTVATDDGVIEYWRALEFYATSYSPSRSGTDPNVSWYGHVYCGGLLQNGFVGVDLDYVPCGTQLYIPGYGYAVAMDTGNIQGAWIDLGYEDDDYQQWNQFVTVYFLTPVPPLENISWVIPPGSFY